MYTSYYMYIYMYIYICRTGSSIFYLNCSKNFSMFRLKLIQDLSVWDSFPGPSLPSLTSR